MSAPATRLLLARASLGLPRTYVAHAAGVDLRVLEAAERGDVPITDPSARERLDRVLTCPDLWDGADDEHARVRAIADSYPPACRKYFPT